MASQNKKHPTECLVANGIDIFGDRWTLLIIRDMMLYGKKTYGDFLEAGEHIATNILADRLKHLEGKGLIDKSRDPDNHRSYIYRLTEKGLSLTPVVLEIVRWSGKYMSVNEARRKLLERIEQDRDGLIAEIYARSREAALKS